MNNSSNISSKDQENRKESSFYQQKSSAFADFNLTYEQYFMLQYYLPKRYVLLQLKPTPGRRGPSNNLIKTLPINEEKQNLSRLSGNVQNTSQLDGRSKRSRIRKIDRYLDDQPISFKQQPKRSVTQKISLDDEMMQCLSILTSLKKHRSAGPFTYPVDPKNDGAYNYLEIIKQPMDLSTVQKNLKLGQYQTSGQFHGDISKIWHNSYAYNQKTSSIYKMTIQMQKYYKNLLANDNILNKAAVIKNQKFKLKDKRKDVKENINLPKQKQQLKRQLSNKKKSQNKLSVQSIDVKDAMQQEEAQAIINQNGLNLQQQENIQIQQQDKDYDGYD